MFDLKNDSNAITIQNSYDEDLNFRLIEIKYYNNEKYFLLQNEDNEYSVYKYDKSSSAFVEITNNKLISMLFGNIGLLKKFQSWFENYLLCIPILVLFVGCNYLIATIAILMLFIEIIFCICLIIENKVS